MSYRYGNRYPGSGTVNPWAPLPDQTPSVPTPRKPKKRKKRKSPQDRARPWETVKRVNPIAMKHFLQTLPDSPHVHSVRQLDASHIAITYVGRK